ncbi:hypothetical protein GCM10010502_12000 [Kitasatospora aureofaciens]|uniref:Uncharacterized protein n=1 Tax=Kitasatospora aureofaciens TaxID=1894 RepID=A0A8H9HFX6_KITAU|nr:hypothetical protein GCM10010502_12000 [Kitasatospora aureofaciens]
MYMELYVTNNGEARIRLPGSAARGGVDGARPGPRTPDGSDQRQVKVPAGWDQAGVPLLSGGAVAVPDTRMVAVGGGVARAGAAQIRRRVKASVGWPEAAAARPPESR